MSEHTKGAVEAARIILNRRNRIQTEFGVKTAEGLADLIDQQTGEAELLATLNRLFLYVHRWKYFDTTEGISLLADCETAIAKAKK